MSGAISVVLGWKMSLRSVLSTTVVSVLRSSVAVTALVSLAFIDPLRREPP